ncbi:MAG TPA: hypothetical protein PLJ18_11570 [Niabella sp.]|nr:hypothetical protein [Bacteroidia bacterium]HOZ91463.1 hypothetical protein [Bacteroidia bacterium]HRB52078.1 hypothetical protein [Bacteroidia bacterium]HRC03085.1 hypothetical protein [Niabella sp.]
MKKTIKPVDVTKIADFYKRQMLRETVNIIQNFGTMYVDTADNKEHVYCLNKVQEMLSKIDEKEKQKFSKRSLNEIKILESVLAKNDCAYIRFIDIY